MGTERQNARSPPRLATRNAWRGLTSSTVASNDSWCVELGDTAAAVSDENVKLWRRLVEAVNRGDFEAARRLTADAVFIPLRAGTEGAYHGHDGLRTFLADNAETFEIFRTDYPETRDLGDRVLAIGTVHIRGRGSGVETEVPSAGVAWFRGGKATRWEDFGDRKLAMEAAGLTPE